MSTSRMELFPLALPSISPILPSVALSPSTFPTPLLVLPIILVSMASLLLPSAGISMLFQLLPAAPTNALAPTMVPATLILEDANACLASVDFLATK